ncbi:hypothetical protein ABPG72_012099 [Tetrahymena utriculariae]
MPKEKRVCKSICLTCTYGRTQAEQSTYLEWLSKFLKWQDEKHIGRLAGIMGQRSYKVGPSGQNVEGQYGLCPPLMAYQLAYQISGIYEVVNTEMVCRLGTLQIKGVKIDSPETYACKLQPSNSRWLFTNSQQQRPAAIIHIVQKYNISQATVSRLLKQFNSQNNSLNEQSISEQSEQEEYSKSEQNNQEQSQNEQNDQEQSVQSAEEQIQNIEQSIQVQESLIEHHNNSLIEYLNEKEQPQEEQKQIIEQKSYQQQRNQQKNNNYYKKYQKDEQQQQIEQVQISQESDQCK